MSQSTNQITPYFDYFCATNCAMAQDDLMINGSPIGFMRQISNLAVVVILPFLLHD